MAAKVGRGDITPTKQAKATADFLLLPRNSDILSLEKRTENTAAIATAARAKYHNCDSKSPTPASTLAVYVPSRTYSIVEMSRQNR